MLKVQSGQPVLPPDGHVVQEETFMDKVDAVVAALSVSPGSTFYSSPIPIRLAQDTH